jgi:hypothetical protein
MFKEIIQARTEKQFVPKDFLLGIEDWLPGDESIHGHPFLV